MKISETGIVFPCAGETLVGVLALPDAEASTTGVVIVVGGPQYRAGSHRQFLLLSRRLAGEGVPVFRFDYRGMGDSSGEPRSFEAVSEDIAAAIDAFQGACQSVRTVVLWGLCDGASAALAYADEREDSRVVGLVLLNPWVRSEATLAQAHLKHYYGSRLLQREFWMKLVSGRLSVWSALGGLLRSAALAGRKKNGEESVAARSFQARMFAGWRDFKGKILLILSGQDYVAKEFIEFVTSSERRCALIQAPGTTRIDIPQADHTFSSGIWRDTVEAATGKWLKDLALSLNDAPVKKNSYSIESIT